MGYKSWTILRGLLLSACLRNAVAQTPTAPASATTFAEALKNSRVLMSVSGGKLSGPGADVLRQALQPARFVLLGEDHATREIPEFAAALCEIIHPDAYAVEVGPSAARMVDALLSKPDRLPAMAKYNREYPSSMAFLDIQEENDLAAHCAASSHNSDFHIWGLDQEFLGAAAPLLAEMVATRPGPVALTAIMKAQQQARLADANALQSGNPYAAYLMAAKDDELMKLDAAVQQDGNIPTRALLHEFTASREIYKRQDHTQNDLRVSLMKQHFFAQYKPLEVRNPDARVFFKFGAVHIQKGLNSLHERDLGNMAAELADAEGTESLHLFIYGAKGTHAGFAGFGKPLAHEAFVMDADDSDKWLTLAIADLFPQEQGSSSRIYTVFDLRTLRFRNLDIPEKWKHVVFAYDIFILMPEITPADYIH